MSEMIQSDPILDTVAALQRTLDTLRKTLDRSPAIVLVALASPGVQARKPADMEGHKPGRRDQLSRSS